MKSSRNSANFKPKKDRFKSARSGKSKLLKLGCRNCGAYVLTYQKDGVGRLHRLYMDRILGPDELTEQQKTQLPEIETIKCRGCGELLATPYVYKKERRLAFRICGEALVNLNARD